MTVTVTELGAKQLQEVHAMKASLCELVAVLEPDDVFVFDAPALWRELDAVARLAQAGATLLARRVEDACTWRSEGFRSAAEQLASLSGTSVSAAKSMLETSRRVAELPDTADALRSGALSAAKAELVAGAASVVPEAEGRLLELAADAPLAKVRDECLRAKAAEDRDETYARLRRERSARLYTDPEGAWHLHARGTVDDGAEFAAVFEPIVDEWFKAALKEGREEPTEAYAFDALIELARRASGASEPGSKRRPSPKALALIRVDGQALRRGAVEGDETCEIAGLGPIPVSVAREILGESVLKLVVTKGVDVANVTHLGRSVTMAQQVALWWRTPGCTVEGCTRTRRIENDHRYEWVETRRTRLDETDPLCGHHHDLKTYDDWALVAGTGSRPMVPPHDPRHPNGRPPP